MAAMSIIQAPQGGASVHDSNMPGCFDINSRHFRFPSLNQQNQEVVEW